MNLFNDSPIKNDVPKHLRVYNKLDSDKQMKKLTEYQRLAPFEQSLSIPSKTYKNCYGEEFFIASIKLVFSSTERRNSALSNSSAVTIIC